MRRECEATHPSLAEWESCRSLFFKPVRPDILEPETRAQVYAMSAMFGYYLRRVDQRCPNRFERNVQITLRIGIECV